MPCLHLLEFSASEFLRRFLLPELPLRYSSYRLILFLPLLAAAGHLAHSGGSEGQLGPQVVLAVLFAAADYSNSEHAADDFDFDGHQDFQYFGSQVVVADIMDQLR